ncbi:MAG: alpha/beta hydrolase [Candidatus Aminicenantales bacterium]
MAERQKRPSPPTLEQLIRRPLAFDLPDAHLAPKKIGLVYRRIKDEELTMDLYSPAGQAPGEKRPAVIFVHGGPAPPTLPLAPKDWGVFVGYGQSAAMSGFIGVTFNHRYFALDRLADAESDILTLITFLRERSVEFGIDRDRLALWSFSGGGPLLAEFLRRPPVYIRALIFFYALMDLRPLLARAKGGLDEATAVRLSPQSALETAGAAKPPIFIGRAGLDNPGLNATIDQFAGLALKKNLLLTLVNHPQGVHGFDARNDDVRTREIIRQAFEFLQNHLETRA